MRRVVKLLGMAGWLAGPAAAAHAQPITILHTFTGADGKTPEGALLLSGSTLYGMTAVGGSFQGTIFQIGTNGAGFGVIHSFLGGASDGSNPTGSLIQFGSSLYGTTLAGGGIGNNGTIFQIGTNGAGFSLLHRFAGGPNDGAAPFGNLLQIGTTFYGTTNSGGSVVNSNGNGTYENGTIFKVNMDGSGYSVLHSFAGAPSDGQQPGYGALVQSGSTLYGMTSGGGAGQGAVYKINADGTGFALLHSFAVADGLGPQASLTLIGSTLYGTTYGFGPAGGGTIFEINTDGTGFKVIHAFAGGANDGGNPSADLLLVGSTLYGTTVGGGTDALGTLFGIGTDGSDFRVLHSFTGGAADGSDPQGDLILAGSSLYGMTVAGGSSNDGVIFSYPVPEPSSLAMLAAAGAAAAILRGRRKRPVSPVGS